MIATGSSAAIPQIPGLDGAGYWTNVAATETTGVPESLLVLGGGPVGCELAQFFARIGSKVTIVEAAARLLPGIDAEAGALVEAGLREDEIEIRAGVRTESFEGNTAVLRSGERLKFTQLLVAVGRRPNLAGLESLGLDDRQGRNRGRRAAACRGERLGDR